MTRHDPTACNVDFCERCHAWLDGAAHGQVALAAALLAVRDHGRGAVPDLPICPDPCEHTFCALAWTMDVAHRAVAAAADAHNAQAWEKSAAGRVWVDAFRGDG